MAKSPASPAESLTVATAPIALISGDDDFSVKQRARQLFELWCAEAGGFDHEIIDAAVSNAGEALSSLGRLREAINTLPFFGGAKVVWFQNCTFLGEDRTAASGAVTEAMAELADQLKKFKWQGVRLLVSSGKADKRRAFYKAVLSLGVVETFNALTAEDKDWAAMAETHVLKFLKASAKEMGDEALAELVNRVGPNLAALANEVEKVVLYVGARREISLADVQLIVTRQKHAKAFGLGEALGERDLPKLLRTLDEELWEVRLDKSRSEIGLLYGLISKLRTLILVKELRREGLLKPARDYFSFKTQLERMQTSGLPEDRRFNPLALHPFVLFSASKQVDNYESHELVSGMETLLECNRRLVSSQLDEALVLQQAVVEIVGLTPKKARSAQER